MLRRRRDVAFDLTLRLPQERYAKNIRKEVIEFKCAFEQQQIFASSLRLKMKQQTNKNRGYHLQYKFGQYATRRSFNLRHIVILFQLNPERKILLSKFQCHSRWSSKTGNIFIPGMQEKCLQTIWNLHWEKITISTKDYFLRVYTV